MAKMTGGQALAQSLIRHGQEVLFGLPGVQLDWIFEALWQVRDELRVVYTRHEQATSYMADGYARSTGKVGVSLVVPGPGLMNAMAGLSTAYACSSPVLCIAGQIASSQIGKNRGFLHEVPHQQQMVASVSKWAACAYHPEEIPELVQEAYRQLRTGRPRPVVLEVPPDVLQATGDVTLVDPVSVTAPAGDPARLEDAARLLGEAKRPVILAGGGVISSNATEEVQALSKLLEAPVIMTVEGKGTVPFDSPYAQNMISGRELFPSADVVLIVGSRYLDPQNAGLRPREGQKIIQIDIDPEEIGRNHDPDVSIQADARLALGTLVERVPEFNHERESREAEMLAAKEKAADRLYEIQPQGAFADAIRAALPKDGIYVAGITQLGFWSREGFPAYQPRTYLSAGYQGTLGFAMATALGAQVGNPDRRAISVSGDGGFMYNVQELGTAVQQGINLVMIVFNDSAYGNVLRMQKEAFGPDHLIATRLYNPDFMKLADSYGLAGRRVHTPGEMKSTLDEVLQEDHPTLIEVPVGELPSVWPILFDRD